ncbi:MAG TPA: NRDE family protein [Candidatus Binataceae bacterium]|nr:NRDE family protein [Candidatus Binataceae bacterium]
MCTLAIYFRVAPEWPVVIAANRDEFLDRPALDPAVLNDNPHVIGGKDLRAGGTWLGISANGLVCGLLNRPTVNGGNPRARSRGLLCLDALRRPTARDAAAFAAAENGANYNPFNLLVAGRDAAFVVYNRSGEIELVELAPGLHLLSNQNVDDFECPKISRSYGRFAELGGNPEFLRDPTAMRPELARLLADHSPQPDPRTGRPNSLCLHLDNYGTRSSSMIFLGRNFGRVEHFFAPGAPCKTAFAAAEIPRTGPVAAAQGR